jgi:hypothetical protein
MISMGDTRGSGLEGAGEGGGEGGGEGEEEGEEEDGWSLMEYEETEGTG